MILMLIIFNKILMLIIFSCSAFVPTIVPAHRKSSAMSVKSLCREGADRWTVDSCQFKRDLGTIWPREMIASPDEGVALIPRQSARPGGRPGRQRALITQRDCLLGDRVTPSD